jgi:hypothetical protein
MARHSWEDPLPQDAPASVPGRHSWEDDPESDHDNDWGECSDDGEVAAETAGGQLVSLLLEHMLYSRLSTAQTCVLMHWANEAGISEAKPYSLRPGRSSGHYSRKMNNALGFNRNSDLYEMEVPGHGKHDLERSRHACATLPLARAVSNTCRGDGRASDKVG